jgi:hypothetical protein
MQRRMLAGALIAGLIATLPAVAQRGGRGMVDPKSAVTLTGEILSIDTMSPPRGRGTPAMGGVHLRLRSGDSTYQVTLGPREFIASQTLKLANGDRVQVTGFRAGMPGMPGMSGMQSGAIIAQIVKKGAAAMMLRDSAGVPLWRPGRGAGAPPTRASFVRPPIPASIQEEHRSLHDDLLVATRAPGRTGAAARGVIRLLDPHFAREEQIALPPLALLEPLSRRPVVPAMRWVLPLTDTLSAELPKMLREHRAIGGAVQRLRESALSERNAGAVALADRIRDHARTEEQVTYPSAILVGKLVACALGDEKE